MSLDYMISIAGPMLEGARTTILLFALAIITSIPLGLAFTFMVRSRIKPVAWFASGYVYVMRGTPLLLQMLFVCFGLPVLPVIGEYLVMDRFAAACLAFTLNYAAYFAEIFRGGLLAIDKGQHEAAKVLGLTRWQTTTRIVMPQMLRVSLPAISNESITLVKDTALLYAVAVPELLHFAQTAVNRDFTVMPLVLAGVIYLLMTLVLTLLFKALERKYKFE